MLQRFPQQIGLVPKRVEIWAGDLIKVILEAPNPEKARVRNRTRRLSYEACESVENCDL